MRISTIIIGLLLVGSLIFGFYSFVNDLADSDTGYDVSVDDDKYIEAFDKSRNISDEINRSYGKIQKLSANTESTIGIVTLVPEILIITIKMVTLPFAIIGGLMTALQTHMGLPAWTTSFLLTIMTILIVFAIIAMILRFRET